MKRLVGLASGLLFFVAASGRTAEKVVARIECPAFMEAKVNWNPKAGENSAFHFDSGTERVLFNFDRLKRDGQLIQCIYKHGVTYRTTVKRKIMSCAEVDPRILECKLARRDRP